VKLSQHGRDGPPWSIPALVRDAVGLSFGLSTLAVSAVLYVLAPENQPLTRHIVAAGVLLLVWCYCDGMVGRLHWGLAVVEALLRLRLALMWDKTLFDVLG
jgi:hypothetical protein